MDFPNDNGQRTLLRIAKNYDVPSYALSGYAMTKDAASKLADTAFADETGRHFPLTSKSDTWWSAAYFNENKHLLKSAAEITHVENLIKRAADIYGITVDVDNALAMAEPQEKQASAEDVYCYQEDGRNYFPVIDTATLSKAASCYDRNYNGYPLAARVGIARGIAKKAFVLGGNDLVNSLPMSVASHSSLALPTSNLIKSELESRTNLITDPELRSKLAECTKVLTSADYEEFAKNAAAYTNLLTSYDEACGLTNQYGKLLLTPHEVVYNVSTKVAEDTANSITLKEHTFDINALATLDPNIFAEALGEDVVADLMVGDQLDATKLAAILPTLPTPDKQVLESAIVESCSE